MCQCGACLSPGMRANPSTCRVLTSIGKWSGSGRWCTFGRTAGRATRSEWTYSQWVYFEAKAGGEVRIFGFYTNKPTKKRHIVPIAPYRPGVVTWVVNSLHLTQVRWTYPLSADILLPYLTLPYTSTYYTPSLPAVRRCLTCPPGAAPYPSLEMFNSLLLAHVVLLVYCVACLFCVRVV